MARRTFSPTFTNTSVPGRAANTMPQFQRAADTPGSSQQFLEQLDEILRRNKGGFTAIGSDASSNTPFRLAGAEPVKQPGIGQNVQERASEFSPYGGTQQASAEPQPSGQPELPPQNGMGLEQFMDTVDQFTGYAQRNLNDRPIAPNGAYGIASMADGGVLFSDGRIYYEDMTYRENQNAPRQQYVEGSEPFAVSSQQDGTIGFSDGSTRYGMTPYAPNGQNGLIRGIFGSDQAVTQAYGNYNPNIEPGSGYNMGTDIRTRDLQGSSRQLRLPIGAEVVDVKYDDGTRFGDRSGHQGYGNSILLRLPSGEMLRFSHLSEMADVQPGQRIEAGQMIGTPGTTGNTYGEHLDLEYYNKEGQISDPSQFSGFVDPQSLVARAPIPGSIASPAPQQPRMSQAQPTQQTQQPQRVDMPTPATDAISAVVEPVQNAARGVAQAAQPMSETRQAAGSAVNQAGRKLGEIGLGASIGNSPEGFVGAGELIAGDTAGAGKELSATIERVNPTPRIDTGISELLRGDTEGAKKNFADTSSRIGARLSKVPTQVANVIAPPAFAADGTDDQARTFTETLGQNVKGAAESAGEYIGDKAKGAKQIFSNAVSKPMRGLSGLKDEFQGTADKLNPFNFDPTKFSPDRKVGDETGVGGDRNVLPNSLVKPQGEQNDIRDPFFKLGGGEKYNNFINKGQVGDGALSIGLFNNDFYKDPSRVSEVFGGNSTLLGEATNRYKKTVSDQYGSGWEQSIRQQYPEDKYDKGSIQSYIDNVRKEVGKFLSGVDLSTPRATYDNFRPESTNPTTPGRNMSPYVSQSSQLAQSLNEEKSQNNILPATQTNPAQRALGSLREPQVKTPSASLAKKPSAFNFSDIIKPQPNKVLEMSNRTLDTIKKISRPEEIKRSSSSSSSGGSSQQQQRIQQLQQTSDLGRSSSGSSSSGGSKTSISYGSYKPPVSGSSAQLKTTSAPKQSSSSGSNNIFSKAVGVLKRLFGF